MRFAVTIFASCGLVFAGLPIDAWADSNTPQLEETNILAIGLDQFEFSEWEGPDLPVFTYLPKRVDHATAPILFVMHGAQRDPERYRKQWIEYADKGGFIIVAPEFSRADFPRGGDYNRGSLFADANGGLKDEGLWSFSAIEPLFDDVVKRLNGSQTKYTLYGHSAGSQFVHRFLFLKPDARVTQYLPANAGWYSFPDLSLEYPYGLSGVPVSEADMKIALAKDVVVLLGNQDTDTAHSSLNRSAGAMKQGPHRFARGKAFFAAAQALASEKGWQFGWSVRVIDGVAHSNGGMAAGAYDLVE